MKGGGRDVFCALFILILTLYVGIFVNSLAAIGSYPERRVGYFFVFLINFVLFVVSLIISLSMV